MNRYKSATNTSRGSLAPLNFAAKELSELRIMIVDGVRQDLELAASLVNEYYGERGAQLSLFADGQEALNHFEAGQGVDIAIMDIPLPGMTGIELAMRMRASGFSGHIVFLTANNDYAAQSYKVSATSYILKPAAADQIHQVLKHIDTLVYGADSAGFFINRKGYCRRVLFRELMYLEVMQHQLWFHLSSGEVEQAYGSLNDYSEQLLSEPRMSRPNQSFIINADYIRAFGKRTVTMWDGIEISVPRNFTEFQRNCLRNMTGIRA